MSIRRGFREHRTRGVFPVVVRVRFNNVIVELPKAHKNTAAISTADARSAARSLIDAARAIEIYEARGRIRR